MEATETVTETAADHAADEELQQIRAARLRLMHVLEPQDSLGMLLITALGPLRAAEVILSDSALTAPESEGISLRLQEQAALLEPAAVARSRSRWRTRTSRQTPPVERWEELLARRGAWLAVPEDPDWPAALTGIGTAQPIGLWGRGARAGLGADQRRAVAFVGCRDATPYGTSVVSHLAGDLAAEGTGVLSGAAFGIDAAAHRAALATAVQGPATVAFLACGIDRSYPTAHERLIEEIAEAGLVLTEVPPGSSPMRHRFLQRNRLIAAMSAVTVVVEARWRSGALNTAHHAMDFGRTVAAVPGSVFAAQSAGCHRLLQEGPAELVCSTADLRALLPEPLRDDSNSLAGPRRPAQTSAAVRAEDSAPGESSPGAPASGSRAGGVQDGLTEAQRVVHDALPVGRGTTPDALCATAAVGIRELLPALARLETLGLARRREDGWSLARPDASARR